MPRFHFHVHNSVHARDEDGVELQDLDAAKRSSVEGARAFMSDDVKLKGSICLSDNIEITDSDGLQLHVTRFGDCLEIRS